MPDGPIANEAMQSDTWFRIGHATRVDAQTGCTVLLFDHLAPTRVDVRGGAPGTRETDLLQAGRLVGGVDAIVLTGGSAFGLASIDGVVRWLADQGRGFPTVAKPVPIVAGAVIYDLSTGKPEYPDADDGYAAANQAVVTHSVQRHAGAGAGATVAKFAGLGATGGIGMATLDGGAGSVTAVVVLNAVGAVRDPSTNAVLAEARTPDGVVVSAEQMAFGGATAARAGEATTIGAVLYHQPVSEAVLSRTPVAAHAGLARCVFPSHTLFDGDTFFASAPAVADTPVAQTLQLTTLAQLAVEGAIRSIFRALDQGARG